MITTSDLYDEIKACEAVLGGTEISDLQFKKTMIKLGTLNTKLLHNMRTNTVLCMKKLGVEPVRPKVYEERPEKEGK